MRLSLLVAIVCLSCSYQGPSRLNRGIKWVAREVPGQKQAIEIVRRHYSEFLKEDLGLINPQIFWVSTPCEEVDNRAVVYNGNCREAVTFYTDTVCDVSQPPKRDKFRFGYNDMCLSGATFTCSEIYVALRPSISKSALAHEIGHCVRLAVMGDPDSYHVDDEWWQVAAAANSEIKNRGL